MELVVWVFDVVVEWVIVLDYEFWDDMMEDEFVVEGFFLYLFVGFGVELGVFVGC